MISSATREPAPTTLTLDEWFALPEDTPGEWADGELVEEEVAGYIHEFLVILLGRLLGSWILPRRGLIAGSDAKFQLDASRGRKPDLTLYFPGSRFPPARGPITHPPDLAIEIVSPTPADARRDRIEKTAEYARFGVRYYWLVDPELRSLEIVELGADGRYVLALGATSGQVEQVPGCEGLVVDLDELWRELDRLEVGGNPAEPSPLTS